MLDTFDKILSRVDAWLKDAKATNAIVIGFNGAAIFGILHLFEMKEFCQCVFLKYYVTNFITLSFAGLFIALISFVPQTRLNWLWRNETSLKKINLLHFGHLAQLDVGGLIKEISKKLNISKQEDLGIYQDYAEQIIMNSKITVRKFDYFRIAVWFTIGAIITFPLSIIAYLIFDPNSNSKYK